MFGRLGTDARYAWRGLVKRPGFTALAVLTLAIGIGATTTVFAMANQALFRPLAGVTGAERAVFVQLERRESGTGGAGLGLLTFGELREAATVFEALGGHGLTTIYASVDGDLPIDVRAEPVAGDYFAALGVRPLLGRLFRPEETGSRADPSLVVISERLWERLFARDPDVVGRRFRANRQTLQVIGVAGGGFAGSLRRIEVDAWVPMSALVTLVHFQIESLEDRHSTILSSFVGRLKPGVSPEAAEDQLGQVLTRLGTALPEEAEYLGGLVPHVYGLSVDPLFRERTYSSIRILLLVVTLVLVIACANVANLLLLRATRRRGEIAVRRALGASRGRVFAQLQMESVFLALLGGAGGFVIAFGLAELFRGERLIRLPAFEGLAPDVRLLAFAVSAALLASLLSGVLPALLGGRVDLSENLREAGGRKDRGEHGRPFADDDGAGRALARASGRRATADTDDPQPVRRGPGDRWVVGPDLRGQCEPTGLHGRGIRGDDTPVVLSPARRTGRGGRGVRPVHALRFDVRGKAAAGGRRRSGTRHRPLRDARLLRDAGNPDREWQTVPGGGLGRVG